MLQKFSQIQQNESYFQQTTSYKHSNCFFFVLTDRKGVFLLQNTKEIVINNMLIHMCVCVCVCDCVKGCNFLLQITTSFMNTL